jgi:tricorn protease
MDRDSRNSSESRTAVSVRLTSHRRHRPWWIIMALCIASPSLADEAATLMRFPTLHGDNIVFEAHGNLWRVNRTGGTAVRLTSEPGYEVMPRYSPDGRWIAFTGHYQGNSDVYVIAAEGGVARRLTFHSDIEDDPPTRRGPDNMVIGWTPDSTRIVYLSRRETWNLAYGRLFTVPLAGGASQAMPLDRGGLLSYSPDGKQIAYNRIFRNFRTWKRYDGGLAQDIDIYDFASKKLTRVTDWPGTETAPMWVGNTIYFLSDHDANRRENIWALDLGTHQFRELTHFTDFDADFPSLGDSGITFQQGGDLYVMDLPSEELHKLAVRVPDDGLHTSPHFVDAGKFIRSADAAQITDYDLSPNGKRVLLTARGDLFSVPAEFGSTRNLTETSNADEDHPAWSPDGTQLAYTTDISGGQQIAVRGAAGGAERILTHFANGFFYQPVWAPAADRLAFSDNAHRLWTVGVNGEQPKQIAADPYQEIHDYSFSPDGRWLAYSLNDANQVRAIWLYNLATSKAARISSGHDNEFSPVFDPEGKHLYFIANRHENPVLSEAEFDASNLKSTGIYVATLQKETASPFAPRSDEGAVEPEPHDSKTAHAQPHRRAATTGESAGAAADDGKSDDWKPGASQPIQIDLDGLMSRAVLLPVPAADIVGLDVRRGHVFYFTNPIHTIEGKLPGENEALHVFDLKERKDATVVESLDSYRLSANGQKVLYKKDKDWVIVDALPPKDGSQDKSERKTLNLSHLRELVDPRQEWREMYDSAWRLERDFFYGSKMNGVDWSAVHDSYAKFLPLLGSRDDLTYLLGEMVGELSNSHTYVGGGDRDDPTDKVRTGLLGVDYGLDAASGRYFFARIYRGDNTREAYRSPLTQPGLKVAQGNFLLAVDGHDLKAPTDPDSLLVGKVDEAVRLTVADSPSGVRRDLTVEPLKQEMNLREDAWITERRQMVDKLSGGRIGYVYLSNMEELGMAQFFRQFYNQIDKQALIVDDRWNGGGFISEIVLERLRRVLAGMDVNRESAMLSVPQQLVAGPKACLINHYSGSDGDLFPHFFRKYGLGPLVGTRTWGGVRGIRGDWPLLDGGFVTVPEDAIYGLDSQWVIENHGVAPDIEIEDSPSDWLAGGDVQLATAVNYLLDELKNHPNGQPPPPPQLPAYPPPGHD